MFFERFLLQIWDAVSGAELESFPHRHIVKSVNFSSDGSHLVSASNEKILRIWDINRSDAGEYVTYILRIEYRSTLIEQRSNRRLNSRASFFIT